MESNTPQASTCAGKKSLDRYTSFEGIDCDGKARRIMEIIEQRMAASDNAHPFLNYFMKKRLPKSGPKPDDLFLIHSNINQIREFFEDSGDLASLELLMQLEEACC